MFDVDHLGRTNLDPIFKTILKPRLLHDGVEHLGEDSILQMKPDLGLWNGSHRQPDPDSSSNRIRLCIAFAGLHPQKRQRFVDPSK